MPRIGVERCAEGRGSGSCHDTRHSACGLEPATWRLELLVAGDNIRAARLFVTVTFDGTWPDPESPAIWEHFIVDGPSPEIPQPSQDATRLAEVHA